MQDAAELQWMVLPLWMSFVPYLILHSLVSSILFTLVNRKVHKCFRILLSVYLIIYLVGVNVVIDILFNLMSFLCIYYLVSGNCTLIWIFTVLIFQLSEYFISSSNFKVSLLNLRMVSQEWFIILYAAHFYIILRGLSVALSLHKLSKNFKLSCKPDKTVESTIKYCPKFSLNILLDTLDYSFYPHTLFLGPLILYSDWNKFWINCDYQSTSLKTLFSTALSLIFKTIRLLFWSSFWSLCLCFVYPNSFGYLFSDVQLYNLSSKSTEYSHVIDRGTIGGTIYLCGLHLFLTYLQFYGWPYLLVNLEWFLINVLHKFVSSITRLYVKNENHTGKFCSDSCQLQVSFIPDPPTCLLHFLLISECWRSFDRGLYNFIKSYIFIPVKRFEFPSAYQYSNFVNSYPAAKTVLALTLSYSFVLLYHGIDKTNIIWLSSNLLLLFSERLVKWIYQSTKFGLELRCQLSVEWIRRLSLLLCAISGIFSVLGNLYFLLGFKAAHQLSVWLANDPTLRLTLFIFAYCQLNLVTDLRNIFPTLRPVRLDSHKCRVVEISIQLKQMQNHSYSRYSVSS
ncbi:unnamed protein product [Heterobilharzia americana]|nr:unnamed protein product [Heterobilharzia americana]